MDKTPGELYKERLKRIEDAIQLKVPDRVPILPFFGFFPARYTNMTFEEAFYNAEKWRFACQKTLVDFEPDMYFIAAVTSGRVLDTLQCKQVKLPGHGMAPNSSQQFVEAQYIEANEYDAFIYDPSDFAIRNYVPRVYGALGALGKLPPLRHLLLGYGEVATFTEILTSPELLAAFDSIAKAGREMAKWKTVMGTFDEEMAELGFPTYCSGRALAPFDLISDYLRGMRGSMLDLYRQPDKVLEACEKLLPTMIHRAVSTAKQSSNPRIFMALHRGADGFMSLKQFETFYWPTLKKLILALVENDLTPCVFFEGDYTSRLEYLLELPKGKILGQFDATDIFKVKEVLGNHMCIMGNIPPSVLQTGTPQEVMEHCKKLIDVVGKNGGYILSSRVPLDDAKPENVKAMFDFTKEYGVYK